MGIADEKYVSLTTFRKSGEGIASPVWINGLSDGRLGFWTSQGSGKTKRLKNDPRVAVQACDARGRVKAGSASFAGTAELVHSGPLFDEVQTKGRAKYGVMVPLTKVLGRFMGQRKAGQSYADAVVLIKLDD